MPAANIEPNFLNPIEMGVGAWAWGDRSIWNYGHGYGESDIEAAFTASLSSGIRLVDTAELYGSGRSERYVGQFLKNAPGADVLIATKFMPLPWRLTRGTLLNALERSLERLQLERVDLYQIHWPFPPMPVDFWVEALARAVESGKARAAGISNYNKIQMQHAYNVLSRHSIPLASNQVEYHLLDRTVEKNGLLDRCKELDVRLIAYSPLAKGLLTGKYSQDNPPPGMRSRQPAALMKTLPELLDVMAAIGSAHGSKTHAQVALNWLICKGAMPIPGAKNKAQAEQNAGALGWRLTPEEVAALDAASDSFTR